MCIKQACWGVPSTRASASVWAKMAQTEVQFAGVLRRMDVSKYGPSWHGQDRCPVREARWPKECSLVSQGDLDKLSNLGVKTTLVRESLL